MKRMLINATDPEEVRVAFVDGQALYDLDIENLGQQQKVGNVYKAKVSKVQKNISGAFLDYGAKRHGFLSLRQPPSQRNQAQEGRAANPLDNIQEGQEIIVQVAKDERREKGAQLSTDSVFRSRYLEFFPNNPNPRDEIAEKNRTAAQLVRNALTIPEGMGVGLKKEALLVDHAVLAREFDLLLETWKKIVEANDSKDYPAPWPLYQSERSPIRVLRDYLTEPVDEIIIDTEEMYLKVREYVSWCMPDHKERVFLHDKSWPLFKHYKVDKAVEQAFERTVRLPSGGTIVIDPAEALVAIDVNSAQAKGSDSKTTAFNTNLEAVTEIARQLRIRDLSGLIVIDFIGMSQKEDEEDAKRIYKKLQGCLRQDRATTRTTEVSKFGLVEIERQRLRLSLQETVATPCPMCQGYGHVPNIRNQSLKILRQLSATEQPKSISKIDAKTSMGVASFILNNKRAELLEIERELGTRVVITPAPQLQNVQFEIREIDDSNKIINFLSDKTPLTKIDRQSRQGATKVGKVPVVPAISRRSGRNFKEILRSLFGLKHRAQTTPLTDKKTQGKQSGKSKAHAEGASRRQDDREGNRGGNRGGRGRGRSNQAHASQNSNRQRRPKPASELQNRQNETRSNTQKRPPRESDSPTQAKRPEPISMSETKPQSVAPAPRRPDPATDRPVKAMPITAMNDPRSAQPVTTPNPKPQAQPQAQPQATADVRAPVPQQVEKKTTEIANPETPQPPLAAKAPLVALNDPRPEKLEDTSETTVTPTRKN